MHFVTDQKLWLCVNFMFQRQSVVVVSRYYFLTYKTNHRSCIHFLQPPLPHAPPFLASSAVWSMGPGQGAKRGEPSLPSICPLPSRRPPVQLCRSPQVPARSDVQHGRQHVHSSPLFITSVCHTAAKSRDAPAPTGANADAALAAEAMV